MPGVSFDRVANIYDQTRGHPPEVAEKVGAVAHSLLPAGRVLEIGVGTGRIARPLLQRGVEVTGLDLSLNMLHRLVEQLPPDPAPRLAQADATCLPFPAGAFQAVLSVHVLHLIPNWEQALEEMRRVLARGGVYLIGFDQRDPASPISRTNDQWRAIAGRYLEDPNHPGVRDFDRVERYLEQAGGHKETIEAVAWEVAFNPGEYIRQIEAGMFSYTWRLDPALVPTCAAELRQWAAGQFGGLERSISVPRQFIWERYTFQ